MVDSPDYQLSPPSLIDQQTGDHYNLSMMYCGFLVIAAAGLILAIYHCLILNCCSEDPPSWLRNTDSMPIHQSCNSPKVIKFDSLLFKYKKSQEQEDEECVVCLSVFEEGEDVRKLVRCKHSFHATCIDKWLFYHFECPLCRTPVVGSLAGGTDSSGLGLSNADSNPV